MIVLRIAMGMVGALVVVALAAAGLGAWTWRRTVTRLDRTVVAQSRPSEPVAAADLPPPVARYLGHSIPREPPRIQLVRLRQSGTFLLGTDPDGWRVFSATEVFGVNPPAFYWDARIRMAPLLSVRVLDSYVEGRGSMVGKVAGLLPVVEDAGVAEAVS